MTQAMADFKVVSGYQPAGDQPAAIVGLVEGLKAGLSHQTLLGVTGSGKTFAIANVVQAMNRPHPGAGAEQDPGGPAVRRVPRVLPPQRGGVLRVLLRLLPAGSLCAGLGHLHREGRLHQRPHRADAPVRHQGAPGAARHPDRRLGVRHLRLGGPAVLSAHGAAPGPRRRVDQRYVVQRLAELQYTRNDTAFQRGAYRGARRRGGHLPGGVREGGAAGGAVRRRDRKSVHL